VSVFGAAQAKSRAQGMLLSAVFVLGIAALMVPLGVVAGMSGKIFGAVLQHGYVLYVLAGIFVLLAAAMFGAYEFALPSGLTNRLATVGGIGYKGAFVLGAACGLIASPCTGPVLSGILGWIAKTGSPSLGALAMSCFALGLGIPFFVVGAFAVQLPKSGPWMVHVKSALGIVLLVVALYLVSSAAPLLTAWVHGSAGFYLGMVVVVLLGLALGAVHLDFAEPGALPKARKGVGIALVTAGAFLCIAAAIKPKDLVTWEHQIELARARAQAESRPMLVDFTASWCGACKELDKLTFSSPNVAPEMARFVNVKVDASNDDDPKVEATLASFKVVGLPTVVIFDSKGHEAVRYNDFVPPERFLSGIKNVD
jgi:thiol:disulfide interchange protein DsbD